MKTKTTRSLLCAIALLFCISKIHAQVPVLLQYWDFNNIRPVTLVSGDSVGTVTSYANTLAFDSTNNTWPLTADYTVGGLTPGHIVYYRPTKIYGSNGLDSICDEGAGGSYYYDYSSSNYSYFTKSDSNSALGNGYIRARNPSDSAEFYLHIPTTGYSNIYLEYSIAVSGTTSANYNFLSYSTDGGTTWKKLTQAMDTFNLSGVRTPDTLVMINSTTIATGVWYPVQINFASDASVNNNPNFILRWMIGGAYATGLKHNDRYDNIAVWSGIPNAINELPAQAAGYNIYPNPANSMLTINGTYNGSKEVTIYNVLGQSMSSVIEDKKQISLNISGLTSGVYLVNIKEVATGQNYIMKIVKN
ncbi:MAG TPA: T9SS type A sorting domain-containing protein [Bacteroidia bacterium]|jgi:hypothetical protein|nr:T9SS type A sorting domain-containing protein [Bacteroidia bacterium]